MSSSDSVGTLLADIATLIADGLRILNFADKRHWGIDEHEQVRALESLLDEAKKDFQDLIPLVNGQANYEHDRKRELLIHNDARSTNRVDWPEGGMDELTIATDNSIDELKALRIRHRAHVQDLKDWIRSGGPINAVWIRETTALKKELHRAQYRAAGRIFTSGQEGSSRCLGAFVVQRKQRARRTGQTADPATEFQRRHLEELVACAAIGTFERFADTDIAYICDFCDGHLVWEDLDSMPTVRTAQDTAGWSMSSLTTGANPNWQATGLSLSNREEKQVVFAPVAIANHAAPTPGDWQSRLLCPYCEASVRRPQDEDDEEDEWKPDNEFEDIDALQEHLEWQHPTTAAQAPSATSNCRIM